MLAVALLLESFLLSSTAALSWPGSRAEQHREIPILSDDTALRHQQVKHQQPDPEGVVAALRDDPSLRAYDLDALFSGIRTLDVHAYRSDCFRDAAASIRDVCATGDPNEDERVQLSIAMTLCELATSRHNSAPMECSPIRESIFDPLISVSGEERAGCVEALSRSAQHWSSYSGYMREIPQICAAYQRLHELDTAKSLYRNTTLQSLTLFNLLVSRERTHREHWAEQRDYLQEQQEAWDRSVAEYWARQKQEEDGRRERWDERVEAWTGLAEREQENRREEWAGWEGRWEGVVEEVRRVGRGMEGEVGKVVQDLRTGLLGTVLEGGMGGVVNELALALDSMAQNHAASLHDSTTHITSSFESTLHASLERALELVVARVMEDMQKAIKERERGVVGAMDIALKHWEGLRGEFEGVQEHLSQTSHLSYLTHTNLLSLLAQFSELDTLHTNALSHLTLLESSHTRALEHARELEVMHVRAREEAGEVVQIVREAREGVVGVVRLVGEMREMVEGVNRTIGERGMFSSFFNIAPLTLNPSSPLSSLFSLLFNLSFVIRSGLTFPLLSIVLLPFAQLFAWLLKKGVYAVQWAGGALGSGIMRRISTLTRSRSRKEQGQKRNLDSNPRSNSVSGSDEEYLLGSQNALGLYQDSLTSCPPRSYSEHDGSASSTAVPDRFSLPTPLLTPPAGYQKMHLSQAQMLRLEMGSPVSPSPTSWNSLHALSTHYPQKRQQIQTPPCNYLEFMPGPSADAAPSSPSYQLQPTYSPHTPNTPRIYSPSMRPPNRGALRSAGLVANDSNGFGRTRVSRIPSRLWSSQT